VAEARIRVGEGAPAVDYLGPWFDHPGFIEAQADRIATAMSAIPAEHRERTTLIFTAHSLPSAMAAKAPYAGQLATSAGLVAARLQHPRWALAYQSRSGDPRTPWLDPDINDVIRALGRDGERAVVVAPIGFVCDHIEVLYDLDTEARETAGRTGVAFHRAGTVMDHPAFIRMLGDLVRVRAAA
jgi:protoporphyrin/coproporphyrin ferrochelatase